MFSILHTPSGRFAFVGKVPAPLAFTGYTEQDLDRAAHVGPGHAMRLAKLEGRPPFTTLSWPSREEAMAAALAWAGSPEELAKHTHEVP